MNRSFVVGKVVVLIVAALGALACNVVDDVVRAGLKAGARGADEAATAGAGHLDDAARKAAGNVDESKLGDVPELAGSLAMELAPMAFESDAPTPTDFLAYVLDPTYRNLITEPGAWASFRDAGEATKHAPWVFDVRPQGEGVLVDNQVIPFGELAASCWQLGTTCIFVGCEDDACATATRSMFERTPPPPPGGRDPIEPYTKILVDTRMATTPQPAFVMFVGGNVAREFTLVRPKKI